MKGKRGHKNTGGANEAEDDLKSKPEARTNAKKIDDEAEEMKAEGEKAKMHAGRKPRKNGGRTGSDGSPFSSARHGKNPSGRNEMSESAD
jgi:hypothetical protein